MLDQWDLSSNSLIADPDAECEIDFDEAGGLSKECLVNTLQSGENLVAAGYCLYSSSTFFCLTIGSGVNIFTLDRSLGEFVLTYPNVKIPQRGDDSEYNLWIELKKFQGAFTHSTKLSEMNGMSQCAVILMTSKPVSSLLSEFPHAYPFR